MRLSSRPASSRTRTLTGDAATSRTTSPLPAHAGPRGSGGTTNVVVAVSGITASSRRSAERPAPGSTGTVVTTLPERTRTLLSAVTTAPLRSAPSPAQATVRTSGSTSVSAPTSAQPPATDTTALPDTGTMVANEELSGNSVVAAFAAATTTARGPQARGGGMRT